MRTMNSARTTGYSNPVVLLDEAEFWLLVGVSGI